MLFTTCLRVSDCAIFFSAQHPAVTHAFTVFFDTPTFSAMMFCGVPCMYSSSANSFSSEAILLPIHKT